MSHESNLPRSFGASSQQPSALRPPHADQPPVHPPEAERADASPQPEPPANQETYHCLFCNAPMHGTQCKLICPNCGYREDCSDLFRA